MRDMVDDVADALMYRLEQLSVAGARDKRRGLQRLRKKATAEKTPEIVPAQEMLETKANHATGEMPDIPSFLDRRPAAKAPEIDSPSTAPTDSTTLVWKESQMNRDGVEYHCYTAAGISGDYHIGINFDDDDGKFAGYGSWFEPADDDQYWEHDELGSELGTVDEAKALAQQHADKAKVNEVA